MAGNSASLYFYFLYVEIPIKNQFSVMIDWSIFKNQFFDPIIYDPSFYFPTIDFLIFFLAGFHHTCRINLKVWTAQSKPWDLSVRVWAYGILDIMKLD